MKKCLILLAVLMTALIISMVAENEDVEMSENIIAVNDSESELSVLND